VEGRSAGGGTQSDDADQDQDEDGRDSRPTEAVLQCPSLPHGLFA
jgi:hypothetical protein